MGILLPYNPIRAVRKKNLIAADVTSATLPRFADIVYKLSAGDIVAANGAPIANNWFDQIHGLEAVQAAPARQPIYIANALGGKPCVRFNGAAAVAAMSAMTTALAGTALKTALDSRVRTIMVVAKPNAGGIAYSGVIGAGNQLWINLDGNLVGAWQGGNQQIYPHVSNAFTVVATSSQTIASGGIDFQNIFVNGSVVGGHGIYVPGTTADLSIGTASSTTASTGAPHDLYDIVIWGTKLTTAELMQAANYFYTYYSQVKPWTLIDYYAIMDGSSIIAGHGKTNGSDSPSYKAAQTLGLSYGQWSMVGINGQTYADMQARISRWSDIQATIGKRFKVYAYEFYNTQAALGTSAATIAAARAYCSSVRALSNTKLAFGTSTSWGADPSALRDDYNLDFDLNHALYCDAYDAIHLVATLGQGGADSAGGNAYFNYPANFNADGVHLSNAGMTILGSGMSTSLAALP